MGLYRCHIVGWHAEEEGVYHDAPDPATAAENAIELHHQQQGGPQPDGHEVLVTDAIDRTRHRYHVQMEMQPVYHAQQMAVRPCAAA